MARSSRSRPSASRSAPASTQSRGHATAAYPTHSQAPPAPAPPAHAPSQAQAQTSQGPGMLAQMAATAGSVAVGSTIGHGISSMLFGGGGSSAPPVEQQQAPPQQQQQMTQNSGMTCEVQAKEFTKCLDKADLQSCSYYLEQLKACQAAAAPY